MMRQVKKALSDFFKVNNGYPTNSKALKEVLPLDQPPLSAFNVRRYSSNGYGYLLILRSKEDPGHVLTLQQTGLMQ